MAEVKDFVIEKMEPLLAEHPSLQIHLSKTYDIPKWFAPGLFKLLTRIKPLDEEDVRLVGLPDSLKVCSLREKLRRCEKCILCGAMIPSDSFCLEKISDLGFDIPRSDLARLARACCACSDRSRLFEFGLPPIIGFNPTFPPWGFRNLRERRADEGSQKENTLGSRGVPMRLDELCRIT